MARAAAKGGKRARQHARQQQQRERPRKSGRRQLSASEQTLFFSRLRRHAKWAYVLLAVLFAATFAVLGVGSGQGSGLNQIFSGIFGGGSGTPSISSSLKQTQENAKDAQAWKNLATAYQNKQGHTQDAIVAWTAYVALRPKNGAALEQLGQLQLQQAGSQTSVAALAQQRANTWQAAALPPLVFSKGLAQGLGADPTQQAIQAHATALQSTASSELLRARSQYRQAVSTFQRLAKLRPNDVNAHLEVANAAVTGLQQTYDTTLVKPALAAYERVTKLDPSSVKQLRSRIKQLQQLQKSASG